MPLLSKLSYWIGQALDNSGGTHPPGWVAFQRWSATASQWQSKDATDAANAATWQTRANTAYDSGTWGAGNTWQTDYNNEVTLYNNEVTAYNNVLPPAAPGIVIAGSVVGTSFNNIETALMQCTADRSGYWFMAYWGRFTGSAGGGGDHADCNAYANGVSQGGRTTNNLSSNDIVIATFAGPFFLGAGQVAEVRAIKTQTATFTAVTQAMQMFFGSTQTYPH